MIETAIVLIAAHLIADFWLQTDELVQKKDKPRWLALHGLVHAALAYVLMQAWADWLLPIFVFAGHVGIDYVKQKCRDTVRVFIADQAAHFMFLAGLAWLLTDWEVLDSFSGHGYTLIVTAGGLVGTVRGAGFLIGKITTKLKEENSLDLDGLKDGGKLIGELERALIFVFIFIGQPGGIGFLVAAKSILRFQEAKDQKLAEYVLIGTLLSFSLAIAIASAAKWALAL